jgi:Uma2 family endonuclease
MAVATMTPPGLTLADLVELFGPLPAHRLRFNTEPGTATEEDVLAVYAREKRLCELVDGVLVEKARGFYESRLAVILIYLMETYLDQHPLGVVAGEAGMMRLAPGLVRIPDVSFVSWRQFPNQQVPRDPIPDLVPELAVEVLSATNTKQEMAGKLRDYFAAGVRLVWFVDPPARAVRVYSGPDQFELLPEDRTLDGGQVLPGFSLAVQDLFARAERRPGN